MVLVRITLQSLMEKRTEMMQTLLSLILAAGKETGCLGYDAFCDLESDNTFNLIE